MADPLEVGETFDVKGYDIFATIRYAETGGEAIVLCNNSTHFIVAIRIGDADDDAEFEASFPYNSSSGSVWAAYRHAINEATEIALAR